MRKALVCSICFDVYWTDYNPYPMSWMTHRAWWCCLECGEQ